MLNGGTQLIILAASTELYKGHEFKSKTPRLPRNNAEEHSAIISRHCRRLALFAVPRSDTSPDLANAEQQFVRILRAHPRANRGPAMG